MLVNPNGGKWWRLKYSFNGKEKAISLGVYPKISLKEARRRRDQAKELVAMGTDPSLQRQEAKATAQAEAREKALTFEAVAREWYAKRMSALSQGHQKKILARLEKQLFPYIGHITFSTLEPSDILAAIRHAESRGAHETAHRLAQLAGQVCRYARIAGYVKFDVAAGLSEALTPAPKNHYPAITAPKDIVLLLQAIDEYHGEISIKYALRLLPYVFVRSGELRGAMWPEINFKTAEWVIPSTRMKMKRAHVVPLAHQVISLLEDLHALLGGGDGYLFPSLHSKSRHISDVGLLNALRRMGFGKEQMCIHGFRSMASTLLNEQGYNRDWIERQLAHDEQNAIRAAYNHAEYLPERRAMMQEWADYLDELKAQA